MRVAVVAAGAVPNRAQSGSTLTVWTIVRHLLGAGHEVGVVVLGAAEDDVTAAGAVRRVAALEALGARVQLVDSRATTVFRELASDRASRRRRLWQPTDVELLPQLRDADAVSAAVEAFDPDVVYAYHWEAIAATRLVRRRIPTLATVVDLPHLSALYRWRLAPYRQRVAQLPWLQARLRRLPRLLVRLLNECEASANFAAHHAEWLRRRGAPECTYLRTPIEDVGGGAPRPEPEPAPPRVLLIGHLRGVSTLDGLDFFAERILPLLERELGGDGFEVRIAGGYDPPPGLDTALARPSVRLLGHLEDPAEEFSTANLLLVPTTIPLGTRVRILSAFSFSCPVVAHSSNALGIPELAHGDNVLLGERAPELTRHVVSVARDAALRERLGRRGRETYETFFAPNVAAARIEEILTELASERRRAGAPSPTPDRR